MIFKNIGLFAKHSAKNMTENFEKLIQFLIDRGHIITIEQNSASLLKESKLSAYQVVERKHFGKNADLVIVIGGDGSLLNAARAIVDYQVPILGVNQGRLGFLADILPQNMEKELNSILNGEYNSEQRSLLNAQVLRENQEVTKQIALNEVVLYTGNISRMIDFEVSVNGHFVLRQQADGLITATPTGSTAYALSAHGPILYPTLNAFSVVPLCPHTLSSRPLVIEDNSIIEILVEPTNTHPPKLSLDGQIHIDLLPGDKILMQKHTTQLTLIHPATHDYFSVLRKKLGWSIPAVQV